MILKGFPNLGMLRMEGNNITKLEGLGELKNLEEIWVDKNRVSNIIGLEGIPEDKIFWWNKICRDCKEVLEESDKFKSSDPTGDKVGEPIKNYLYSDMRCGKCHEAWQKLVGESFKAYSDARAKEQRREWMKRSLRFPP